jgi:hypothetical protein
MSLADEPSKTPEKVANGILARIKTVSLITASSACSVIFKCTSLEDANFCMKVSFVRLEKAAEPTVVTYTVMTPKQTTTITEAEKTRERQHQMCSELQDYNDTLTFIPDAVGSCTLTPAEFDEYLKGSPDRTITLDTKAQHHINLIVAAAKPEGLSIHVLFMELLQSVQGYDSFTNIQHTPYIVAAILAVTIVTGVASQDTHPDNVQISVSGEKVNVLKLIDWDRSICIYDEADIAKIADWISSLMDKNTTRFLLVCKFFLDEELNAMIQTINLNPDRWPEKINLNQALWLENKKKIQQKLIDNFITYYDGLSQRILDMKSSWRLITKEQGIYDIFDLLTFIGFMDCLSKAARYRFIDLMQFSPFIYNLFINTDDVKILEYPMISLADLVTFRQKYLKSLSPVAVSSKRSKPDPESVPVPESGSVIIVKSRLDAIIVELNGFLVPDRPSGSGGRPRYIKRTHRKTIKKQHRIKNNQKSIRRIYRRSKIRKRNTRN